jgi:radical SAM enzyme (TIGR01210 family)
MSRSINEERMPTLEDRVKKIMWGLRSGYYRLHGIQTIEDSIPFGGSIRESIGPFPEFILKGRFCKRSARGLCSPCFYSRLPEHSLNSNDEFDKGYLKQVDHIIERFDTLVLNNQIGKIAFPVESEKRVIGMVCTPTGSYFDKEEYPLTIRKENLKKIARKAGELNRSIALHIESHANDVIEYFQSPDIEELELLKCLNARILLGFESIDEFSRNVIYVKDLKLEAFLEAVTILRNYNFPVGAFVFAGLFPYTDYETIEDVTKSLLFLKEKGIPPVLMFANTQKYTIPDVLYAGKRYKLVDARTVLEIVRKMIDIFSTDMNGSIDPWFIADPKGGPPEPKSHIFISGDNSVCADCSNRIYELIEELRITKNTDAFLDGYNEVNNCKCRLNYDALIQKNKITTKNQNIEERTRILLDYADNMLESYLLIENPWVVKAQLLCYGLCLTGEQKETAKKYNKYINEKGLIHAVHIRYQETLINVCVAEEFCGKSPFTALIENGDSWVLLKNGRRLGNFDFLSLPEWTEQPIGNFLAGDLVRPHADKCISLWPSQDCVFVKDGMGCKFCGLTSRTQSITYTVDEVIEAVSIAMKYNPEYEVNISGGTCYSADKALDYLIEITGRLKERFNKIVISAEFAPPQTISKIKELKDAGAAAAIINIEIFDDASRKEKCPGKGQTILEKYIESLKCCVDSFGQGNVSSVVIVGLQPEPDVEKACKTLISIGVVPTLMPFKPLDGTPLQNYPLANDEEYIKLSRYSNKEMNKINIGVGCHSGCAACGACSLEIDLKEIFKL